MKKSTKFISLLLAVIMVFSVIPFTASANAIDTKTYDTVDKLISNDSIVSLFNYLIENINKQKDNITGTVLRLVFMFIGDKLEISENTDVTKLSDEQCSKILLDWIDKNLPEWTSDITEQSWYGPVSSLTGFLGVTLNLKNVDGILETVSDVIGVANSPLFDLGIANNLNNSSIKGLKRSGGDLKVIKQLLKFLVDNEEVLDEVLKGNLNLGIVSNFIDLKEYAQLIKELPLLIKSFLYKLIKSDAEAGAFKKGEMGGEWATSPYAGYTADELLGAALIKAINGTDDVVSKTDAGAVTKKSFYDLLADYAEPVFNKFALDPLNELITKLNSWLAEQTNAELKALFKSPIAPVTTDTFSSIFAEAKTEGLLEELNNILLAALKHIFADKVYTDAKLVANGNENLNANLTKIARYALPILVKLEDMMGYTFPDEIKNADPEKLSLADMATYILKPFFESWFGGSDNFSKDVVNSAASLPALAVLAVNYTATTKDWLDLDYDFSDVTAKDIKDIKDDAATDKVLATAAGIAIGALKHNADSIHFTAKVDGKDWKKDLIAVENWGLDFVTGLPAVARVHDLRNADGYGPFYKVNVLLNELIDFAFLNDVNSATFKLDLEKLLTSLCAKLYNFDLAGIIHIFEKNAKSGNVLNGVLNTSVIGIVDRILTALFEHNCGTSAGKATETVPDAKDPCTKGMRYDYTYCMVCGAYSGKTSKLTFERKGTAQTWDKHVKDTRVTKETVAPTEKTCTTKTITQTYCTICNKNLGKPVESTAAHKMKKVSEYVYKCSVCGYEEDRTPTKPDEPEVPTYLLGDVNNSGKVDTADARLALRRAIDLETYPEGSPEFVACDVNKDGAVTTGDARFILRKAIGLVDPGIAW